MPIPFTTVKRAVSERISVTQKWGCIARLNVVAVAKGLTLLSLANLFSLS